MQCTVAYVLFFLCGTVISEHMNHDVMPMEDNKKACDIVTNASSGYGNNKTSTRRRQKEKHAIKKFLILVSYIHAKLVMVVG